MILINKVIILDSRALFCRKEVTEFLSIDEKVEDFEIWTTEEVIQEIRDESTRQYLENLPYELLIKHPSPNSILHVRNFAKKTGDYLGLSETDIRVMSLAYQAIKLRGEVKFLNKEPPALTEFKPKWNNKPKKQIKDTKSDDIKNKDKMTSVDNEASEKGDKKQIEKDNQKAKQELEDDGWAFVKEPKKKIKNKKKKMNIKKDFYPEKFLKNLKQNTDPQNDLQSTQNNSKPSDSPEPSPVQPLEPSPSPQSSDQKPVVSSLEPESTTNDDSNDSCDDEWISPENINDFLTASSHIQNINSENLNDNSTKVSVKVVTSDFSMQNVLMMLGIP